MTECPADRRHLYRLRNSFTTIKQGPSCHGTFYIIVTMFLLIGKEEVDMLFFVCHMIYEGLFQMAAFASSVVFSLLCIISR